MSAEMDFPAYSTGIPGLDDIVQGLHPGDNLVWRVDSIDTYAPFARRFAEYAMARGRKPVYFRFAAHEALLPADMPGLTTHIIDLDQGFESITAEIYNIIEDVGRDGYLVFDCLSDLSVRWYSDLMLGNFFMLTCPHVLEIESLAYFGILRHRHSFPAAASIRDTTQIIFDVYRHRDSLYLHPMKVWQRHSSTMYLPHVWGADGRFTPVTDSATVSEVTAAIRGLGMDSASRVVDRWDRTFMQARDMLEQVRRGERPESDLEPHRDMLLRMVISREEPVLRLVSRYLGIEDILEIRKRSVGTGLIGGKSVGMLVSRAILKKHAPRWNDLLEVHDSFYIGSDVFYTYLVANGCWKARQCQRNPETCLDGLDSARELMLGGVFPEFILRQFVEMLDYLGQFPIIVRSSSLLEDNFGNAFSGKYESVFCVNQGTREERLDAFLDAVRRVYASSMSRDALQYRVRRGLLERDEQMAVLVQRVSGAVSGNLFFPRIAGVGLSYNPYAWSEKIDPEAGMIRLVCGLGTRAVNRHDDDYTRIVALNEPRLRPESNFDEVMEYAQKYVDVLDLEGNAFARCRFDDIARLNGEFPLQILASQERGRPGGPWVLTFERLLTQTDFVADMREMLGTLQRAYDYPVDVEFTANFRPGGGYRINIVQCRPLQVTVRGAAVSLPVHIDPARIVFEAHGAIIGRSTISRIDRIVFVNPAVYGGMTEQNRHRVARLIGRITHLDGGGVVMLVGPGRWGTSMSQLGVPVRFAEINTVSVVCELVEMHDHLVPDVSLGTHFFNDVVETDMVYIAVFPHLEWHVLNRGFLTDAPNRLPDLLPDQAGLADAVRVIDVTHLREAGDIVLHVDAVHQRALCYITTGGKPGIDDGEG